MTSAGTARNAEAGLMILAWVIGVFAFAQVLWARPGIR